MFMCANIDIDFVETIIHKGQHKTPELRALNPLGKVPIFTEGSLVVTEGAAILTYLAATNLVEDHWYPEDPKARVRVDAALHWHHGNVRKNAFAVLKSTALLDRKLSEHLGIQPDRKLAADSRLCLTETLQDLENYWLKESSFVAGRQISVADLLMVTELDTLRVLEAAAEGPSYEELFRPFTLTRKWMSNVIHFCIDYRQLSSVLYKSESTPGNATMIPATT